MAPPGVSIHTARVTSTTPWAKWNALSHDSYTCTQFPRTSPFPTEREMGPNNFVASVVEANDVMRRECPLKCRPKEHKEWKYC